MSTTTKYFLQPHPQILWYGEVRPIPLCRAVSMRKNNSWILPLGSLGLFPIVVIDHLQSHHPFPSVRSPQIFNPLLHWIVQVALRPGEPRINAASAAVPFSSVDLHHLCHLPQRRPSPSNAAFNIPHLSSPSPSHNQQECPSTKKPLAKSVLSVRRRRPTLLKLPVQQAKRKLIHTNRQAQARKMTSTGQPLDRIQHGGKSK